MDGKGKGKGKGEEPETMNSPFPIGCKGFEDWNIIASTESLSLRVEILTSAQASLAGDFSTPPCIQAFYLK